MNPPTQTAEGHTPLPWTSDEDAIIRTVGGGYLGSFCGPNEADEDLANARLCVLAVNSHAALTARAEQAEARVAKFEAALLEAAKSLKDAGNDLTVEYPATAKTYYHAADVANLALAK